MGLGRSPGPPMSWQLSLLRWWRVGRQHPQLYNRVCPEGTGFPRGEKCRQECLLLLGEGK